MTVVVTPNPIPTDEYMHMRNELISEDEHTRIGAQLNLTEEEKLANDVFMKVGEGG